MLGLKKHEAGRTKVCEAIDVMPVSRYSSAAGMNPLLLHLASVNQEANVSLHFHTKKTKYRDTLINCVDKIKQTIKVKKIIGKLTISRRLFVISVPCCRKYFLANSFTRLSRASKIVLLWPLKPVASHLSK